MITVGSLFTGIGGIDLGLERAGMTTIWQAETDPYANRILAKHWPNIPNHGDVTTVDWSTIEQPDLICGGFPCQPVSTAGRRLAQADQRWLWPHFARAIRDLRPNHILVENVPGLLIHAMGDVLGDLATLGYNTEWQGIPAAAVGAPHLRWRIFIVAHTNSCRLRHQPVTQPRSNSAPVVVGDGPTQPVAHTNSERLEKRRLPTEKRQHLPNALRRSGCRVFTGEPERREWWSVEPSIRRVANGIPHRVDRLRCLGNAVVPQVAEYIGRALAAHIEGGDSR